MPKEVKDLVGMKFPGGWIVNNLASSSNGPTTWYATHRCGHTQECTVKQLKSGRSTLCKECGKQEWRNLAKQIKTSMNNR